MTKKQRTRMLIIFGVLAVILLAGSFMTNSSSEEETVQTVMRDAVVHDTNQINFLGLEVNPGLVAGFTVTGILTVFALIVRIFVIPRFKMVPGKFQMVLEMAVSYFDNLSKSNSPRKNKLLSAYVFAAGLYIFTGTMFELFGVQAITTTGASISLPAPLSDINGAIMMGCTSYLFIMIGGIANNGFHGFIAAIKKYSLPISMSFRLFGALLSGALVTELVYYYSSLSYGVPVIVGVLFTCLHALIQAYVLTMIVALFYGEISEPPQPKEKKKKKSKKKAEEIEQTETLEAA